MPELSLPVRAAAPGGVDAEALERGLRELDADVRFGRHDRMLYATDASIYQVEPVGVVIPRTVAAARRAIEVCAAHGAAILPRGGGTALAGQTVNAAVVVDLSRHCTALLEVDAEARTARVEPGIVLDHLNDALAADDLSFGPDVATAAHATLGGMIGNNSAGARSIVHGHTVEHLLGVELQTARGEGDDPPLVLDAGAAARDPRVAELARRVAEVVTGLAAEIRARYPRTRRRVDGYNLDLLLDQIEAAPPGTFDGVNLAHLVCGAEGTLGMVTEATLRLVPRPRRVGLALASFGSVDEALRAVAPILETRPSAVELLDEIIIDLARRNRDHAPTVAMLPPRPAGDVGAVLYVEYQADDDAGLADRLAALGACAGAAALRTCDDPDAMARAWKLRKAGEPLLYGMPGERKPITFVEDTAVDPGRLPSFVADFRAMLARHGTHASYYAHASVGCLHIRPMIALRDPGDRAAMEAIASDAEALVRSYGGALSGEHGDGRLRSHLLRRFYGDAICDGFAAIKAIFDPRGLMNPGNIVDPPGMAEHLRVGPAGPAPPLEAEPYFRYAHEHDLRGAVELCNGAGVCRRTTGGTMCPSYRATRDERHATRGRGNALRLAVTGQLSADGRPAWDDPETLETLDLCLSCKACKSECPSNVDVARMKAEFLAQRARVVGVDRRAKRFGHVRGPSRVASALHPIVNALGAFAPTRAVAARALGLDPRRSLPRFGPSLARWHARRSRRGDGPAVVLLPDCFATYAEPAIGRAAIRLLEGLGYRVVLPRTGCCGRAMISQGLLDDARETCAATATDLAEAVARHDAVAIVGIEPSCVSAVRDDWLELVMPVPLERLRDLAARTSTVEAFVESRWDDHPRRPRLAPIERPVLLHGHCHQKALWGTAETAALLRRAAGDGAEVTVLDAGCCGMAGAFGFTPEHYDLSMQIAELALLPAVRARPDAIVAATGTSCRHQVLDGTGRRAVHPVELVEPAAR